MEQTHPVLVCVTGQKTCDRLIQRGQQLAQTFNAPLQVVHVAPAGALLLGGSTQSDALNYLYQLSSQAGAEMTVLRAPDPLERLIQYAKEVNAAHMVLGAGSDRGPDHRDVAGMLRVRLPQVEIHVVMV